MQLPGQRDRSREPLAAPDELDDLDAISRCEHVCLERGAADQVPVHFDGDEVALEAERLDESGDALGGLDRLWFAVYGDLDHVVSKNAGAARAIPVVCCLLPVASNLWCRAVLRAAGTSCTDRGDTGRTQCAPTPVGNSRQ